MPDNARHPHDRRSRAALTFVLLSVFIDSLGFGIIIPSLPSVIMQLTGEPVSTAADWGGYLMAVYALLQFFMAPDLRKPERPLRPPAVAARSHCSHSAWISC